MFCSSCGAEVGGNFCSRCGAPVNKAPSSAVPEDWSREVRYEKLICLAEVRAIVGRHAATANARLSAEEFLAVCDNVVPLGLSLQKLGAVVKPISARLGIRTGKERSETLSSPPGSVIVSVLCSFARHGQVLQQVRQFEDGCLLEATLPSDMWSWEGALCVGVRKAGSGTRVEGATKIKGQLFDWGKSRRCLESLFADIQSSPSGTPPCPSETPPARSQR